MVSPKMVGIFELMTDEGFMEWIERQSEALLARLTTFEAYQLYLKASS